MSVTLEPVRAIELSEIREARDRIANMAGIGERFLAFLRKCERGVGKVVLSRCAQTLRTLLGSALRLSVAGLGDIAPLNQTDPLPTRRPTEGTAFLPLQQRPRP